MCVKNELLNNKILDYIMGVGVGIVECREEKSWTALCYEQ